MRMDSLNEKKSNSEKVDEYDVGQFFKKRNNKSKERS